MQKPRQHHPKRLDSLLNSVHIPVFPFDYSRQPNEQRYYGRKTNFSLVNRVDISSMLIEVPCNLWETVQTCEHKGSDITTEANAQPVG
jgi:hypothetical protein